MHGDGVTGTLLGIGDRHSYVLHGTTQRSHSVSESPRAAGFGDNCLCHSSCQRRGKQFPKA